MTNNILIKEWRTLSIKFKTSKEVIPLVEMFLVCPGETKIDVGGKEETVVIFYQAFDDKGSPSAMFASDKENGCWAYALDTNKSTHIKSRIGKFVKNAQRDEQTEIRGSKKRKASGPSKSE